jgi:hypothetical protein
MSATTIFTKNHPPNGTSTSLRLRHAARRRVSFLFSAAWAWARFSCVLMHHDSWAAIHAARDLTSRVIVVLNI